MKDEPLSVVCAQEKKVCAQCGVEKDIGQFHKVTNQYTDVHPMSICKECYKSNQEAQRQKQAAEWESLKATVNVRLEDRQTQEEREERERLFEQERLARQQAEEAWYLQQPDRQCIDCKLVFPASAFGYSIMREVDEVWLPVSLPRRCRDCHEAYRERGWPLCQMCSTRAPVGDFLRAYQGHKLGGGTLNGIKVCCTRCISRFEALSETEQLELLRRAMVKAYGERAVIYALQYDDQFPCQHIGRTKLYKKRMGQYKRDWYREIKHHFALQELSFGPLSVEYESRWIMHALKHGWPIDNFELFRGAEDGFSVQHQQARLTEAVQSFEPLTAPFEMVGPLMRGNFLDVYDAEVVNWYCSQYARHLCPSEQEMVQRIILIERLHGLKGASL